MSTDKIYRYSNGSWDSGFAIPSEEDSPSGLTIDPVNGDILLVGESRNKIYRYSNGSWDSGFDVLSRASGFGGIAIDSFIPPTTFNKGIDENINIVDNVDTDIQRRVIQKQNYENITIAESIDIQVVYGSEVTQQEFELLSKWYVAESFTKTWLIPEAERPVINTKLTPSGENRELVKVEITIFGTLTIHLSSDVTGSVTQGGDDLSHRFESNGHAKISASNRSVTFSVADSADFEEPYILENRIPGNAFFSTLSTVNKRQSGKLALSDGNIVEKHKKGINESINIHEAIFIGADNSVRGHRRNSQLVKKLLHIY